jgi:hypothetical protein
MNWEQQSAPEEPQSTGPAQLGAAFFAVLTVLLLLCYVAIFVNPQLPINPFPPPQADVRQAAQHTSTPTVPPTYTPEPTFPPTWTPTVTPLPTWTFVPQPTSTRMPPKPTTPPKQLPAFSLAEDPLYVKQMMYPGSENWWNGLAGEVADRSGLPVTDVTIRIRDQSGNTWETTPGNASRYANDYGEPFGGRGTFAWWEQVLKASCQQSIKVYVQVIRDGNPVSPEVAVQTKGTCDQNLILVHFTKNY